MTDALSNVTFRTDYRNLPSWYKVSYIITCTCIALVSFTGNSLMFYVISTRRKLQIPTNLFILSLVTADLLSTTLMVPLYIERYAHQEGMRENIPICLLRKYLYIVTSSGSITSLAIISLDRLIAISNPFWYERHITKKFLYITLVLIWLWLILFNGVTFYNFESWTQILPNCYSGLPRNLYFIVTPTGFYIPGLIIIFIYLRIFCIARKHQNAINEQKLKYKSPKDSFESPISTPYIVRLPYENCSTITISKSDMSIVSSNRTRSNTEVSAYSVDSLASCDSPKSRSRTITVLSNKITEGKNRIKKAKQNLSLDLKAAKTIGILVGVFLFCWCPIAIYYIYINIYGYELETNNQYGYLHDIFMLLSYINSMLDPYLYTLRDKKVKRCVIKILKKAFYHLTGNNVL